MDEIMDPSARITLSVTEWQTNTSGQLDVISWFIGPLFDILLYGVVLTLVFTYARDAWCLSFSSSASSPVRLFSEMVDASSRPKGYVWPSVRNHLSFHSWIGTAVFVVFVLSTLKTTCSFYILIRIGAVESALYFLRVLDAQPVLLLPFFTSLTALSVQIYYIARLNMLLSVPSGRFFSKVWFRWALITLVLSLSLASSALSIVSIKSLIVDDPRLFSPFLVGCLVAAFMSDAIITTFTILAMLQVGNRQTSNKSHRSLVGRIARFTALSAAIPAVFSLLQVALVMTPKKYSRWHMTVNFVLAKTYDLSLLWTIAYRKRVIERQKQQQQEHHEKQQQQQYRLNVESADPPPPHHLVQLALGVGLASSNGDRMDGKEMNGSLELLNNTSMFARTLRFSAMPMGAGGIVVGGGGGGLNPSSNLYPYSNPVLAQNRFEVASTPESDLEMERLPSSSPQTLLKEKE